MESTHTTNRAFAANTAPMMTVILGRRRAEADGELGDVDPIKAVHNTLKGKQFDEILVSTLPHARSRWVRQDLPAKLKKFGLPVTHVVSN